MITFIGSTNFSGSTFLDVMLGNGGGNIACGELYALFRRDRVPKCTCDDPDCNIWEGVKAKGWKRAYQTLYGFGFKRISDSSKVVNWYLAQSKRVRKMRRETKTVFIYKHPLNLLYSFFKRRQSLSHRYWLRYYGDYLSKFPDALVVSYEDLVTHPAKLLRKLCEVLGYPYFKGKERFWEGVSHHLYGSHSVRIHFHDRDDKMFNRISRSLRKRRRGSLHSVERYRTIYNVREWEEKLPSEYQTMPSNIAELYVALEGVKLSP